MDVTQRIWTLLWKVTGRVYDFRGYLQAIRRELTPEGYTIGMKANDTKTIHSAFIQFPGLLYELPSQLSPMRYLRSIGSGHPSAGGCKTGNQCGAPLFRPSLQHHDKATLLAGKLHAFLQRSYTKGRDLYDLLWYLSDPGWPQPNLVLLNNALAQTNWPGGVLSETNWREKVRMRLRQVNWSGIVEDVRPFVEPGFQPEFAVSDEFGAGVGRVEGLVGHLKDRRSVSDQNRVEERWSSAQSHKLVVIARLCGRIVSSARKYSGSSRGGCGSTARRSHPGHGHP